jgi:hypothetical protein
MLLPALPYFVYNEKAQLVTTYALATLPVAGLQAPNLMKYAAIPASDLAAGFYLFVIKSGTQEVFISEWQQVTAYSASIDDGTRIIKYSHSYNKHDYYQELGEIQLRVECIQGIPDYKADLVDYVDDQRTTEILNGKLYTETPFSFDFIPDWMQRKLNHITVLDTVSIDDLSVVRGSDAQFDVTKTAGYNLVMSSINLLSASNTGVIVDNVTGDEVSDNTIIINMNPQGFGNDDNVVQVTVNG